jgi:hypothetical protein
MTPQAQLNSNKRTYHNISYRNFHATVIVYFLRLFLASEIYLEKSSMEPLKAIILVISITT